MYTYREIQGIALFELKEKNRFADFVPRFVRGIMRFFPGYSRYPRAVREVVVNENTGGEGRGEKKREEKKTHSLVEFVLEIPEQQSIR